MQIGLFFGSFNPIHVGHLIVAEAVVASGKADQVWFVVSPHNPHKKKAKLAHEHDRLEMVRVATADNSNFRVSDVEFRMPQPNYTIYTLNKLAQKHPQHNFQLIIGEDNLLSFPRWQSYKEIIAHYGLLVYPRPGLPVLQAEAVKENAPLTEAKQQAAAAAERLKQHSNCHILQAPLLDISATYIRKAIAGGKSIRYLVVPEVEGYIRAKLLFQ